jgi:hypothetical protein
LILGDQPIVSHHTLPPKLELELQLEHGLTCYPSISSSSPFP